ncbi:MAG: 16S rRNA (cytosine(1402)-N(4))-methyltransferase RsmH [Planctomycetes bacterium]|nr:16S rRNA (cytosine(1402)-N(4))-methyltransferase RsmH [Planctomycetota bacterium]
MRDHHIPVLLEAVLDLLAPPRDGVVVDCTGGSGGHARALGERMGPRGRLVVLDRDGDAVAALAERLRGVAPDVRCCHADFRDLDRVLAHAGVDRVDRLLADLGLSSVQLDDPERGFSFQAPGPLDMRFDRSGGMPAEVLVNHAPLRELVRILRQYGEEPCAEGVGAAIVASRPMRDTVTLAEVIRRVVPRAAPGRDRATRSFQALRIAVNDELGALDQLLDRGIAALAPGGRMAVITFHSLETRRVKTAFRGAVKAGRVSLLTPKPIRPTKAERMRNPRSRSAVLRCVERLPFDDVGEGERACARNAASRFPEAGARGGPDGVQ